VSELNPLSDNPLEQESPLSSFDEFLPSGDSEAQAPRFREGLPTGYRMRADAHYVEQLESSRPAAGAAAGRRTPAPNVSASSESDVLTSLHAISSCAALVDDEVTGLTRQVATSLIRAESWRSTCLLQASRIVRQGIAPTRRSSSARRLVSRLVEAVEHERKLRGVQVDTLIAVADNQTVTGQEDTLMFVLSGLTLLTIELAATAKDASVLIAALPEPAGRITLAISQDSAPVPESWPSVVGEAGSENAGAWSTPVPVLALRRVAEAYGGSVSTTRFANGSRLLLELPIASKPT
jgi:hypothetical protein